MIILHGENIKKSRDFLNDIIKKKKASGFTIKRFEGKKTSLEQVIQECEGGTLFGEQSMIVIEELLTSQRKNIVKQIIEYLSKAVHEVVIWEKKKIDQRKVSGVKNMELKEFKVDPVIFEFLDNVKPNSTKKLLESYDKCLEKEPPELIFFMLVRQVRMMIESFENTGSGNWFLNKVKSQAKAFGMDKLLLMHQQLVESEIGNKTGKSVLPLEIAIERILLKL